MVSAYRRACAEIAKFLWMRRTVLPFVMYRGRIPSEDLSVAFGIGDSSFAIQKVEVAGELGSADNAGHARFHRSRLNQRSGFREVVLDHRLAKFHELSRIRPPAPLR